MRYLSVCSGIEAASVAWHPLGWQPVAFAEIESFPRAVLKHHYPSVPNYGDMTKFKDWPDAAVDLLVGGTPCQSFSVAGLRKGLADPRGNLALTFLAIADRYRPRWVVWENVPGVLSATSHDGPDPRPPSMYVDALYGPPDGEEVVVEDEYDADEVHAFACLVAGFSELGYFGAYRTPDAQYFGLAQRRARVFALFHLGDWRRAAAVLFERESLSGHPAPSREAGQGVAGTIGGSSQSGGFRTTDLDNSGAFIPEVFPAIKARDSKGPSSDGDGDGACLVPVALFDERQITCPDNRMSCRVDGPVPTMHEQPFSIAFTPGNLSRGEGPRPSEDVFPTLTVAKDAGVSDQWPCVAFAELVDPVAANQGRTYTREGSNNFRLSNVAITGFQESQSGFRSTDAHPTLDSNNGSRRHHGAVVGMRVRRLTGPDTRRSVTQWRCR